MRTIYFAIKTLVIAVCLIQLASAQGLGHTGAVNESPKEVKIRSGKAVVPMTLFGRKPVVDVMINGKGPFRFFLDTGAGGTVLNQDLADELKLPTLGKVRIGDPTNPQAIEATRDDIDRLEIGGAVFMDLIAVSFDRSVLYQEGAPRGVLGMPLFAKPMLTVDYPLSQVVIASGELAPPNGTDIVEYKPSEGGLFGVPVKVGSRELVATLDTGSGSRLSFPPDYMDKLALEAKPVEVGRGRTVGGEAIIYGAKLKETVRLGGYSFDGMDITFFGRLTHLNIGYGFLSQFAVTIDQQNHRMRFFQSAVATGSAAAAVAAATEALPGKVDSAYAGMYGERRISLENGDLYLQRLSGPMGEGPKLKLVEVSRDAYAIAGMGNEVHVKFIRNPKGEVGELQVLTQAGTWENAPKAVSSRQ